MIDINKRNPTIVLDNSPISFVLTGPGRINRTVYARSNDKNLDLVGLDAIPIPIKEGRRFDRVPPWALIEEADEESHLVRSKFRFDLTSKGVDEERLADFTFAWRGSCSEADFERIERVFRLVSFDISMSIDQDNVEDMEWQISPVILLCREASIRGKKAKIARRNLFMISGIVYLVVTAILILSTSDFIGAWLRSNLFL